MLLKVLFTPQIIILKIHTQLIKVKECCLLCNVQLVRNAQLHA